MVGLKKGKVELLDHDPSWADAFEKERTRALRALEQRGLNAKVEHVGSTAVAGIKAKPIIDVAVGLARADDVVAATQIFVEEGLTFVTLSDRRARILLTKGDPVAFHYHLSVFGSWAWKRLIIIRDHLRAHPAEAAEYERIKIEAAKAHPESRAEYTSEKVPHVEAIAHRAFALERARRIATTVAARRGDPIARLKTDLSTR